MKRSVFTTTLILVSCLTNISYGQFSFLMPSQSTASHASATAAPGDIPKLMPIVGAFTFPFKYRPQTGIFEPSLSLSGAIGVCIPLNSDATSSINFMGSFGPSSITLTKNNSADTGTGTRSSATSAFTILGQWNKIQLAISVGIDDNLDNTIDKWTYQSKPWFSFGFGYSVFSSK